MHLTLRTLLAYLDDNLDPEETRRIGDKVAHSEKAKDLVERIAAVVRKRRLLAYDADPKLADLDPNWVAEYLDGVLDEKLVARLERLCLDDDMALAEVAATNQILSRTLSEPASFSDEARRKAYAAVGLKPAAPTNIPTISPTPATPAAPPPASRTGGDIARWALALTLLVGVIWAGVQAALPAPTAPLALANANKPQPAAPLPEAARPAPAPAAAQPVPEPLAPAPATVVKVLPANLAAALPLANPTPMPEPLPAPAALPAVAERVPPPLPMPPPGPPEIPGPAGPPKAEYVSVRGVLLRQSEGGIERLQTAAKLGAERELLVNLDGSRSRLQRGDGSAFELVDQARLAAHSEGSPALELLEGRVALRAAEPPTAFVLHWGNDVLRLEAPAGPAVAAVQLLPAAPGPDRLPPTLLIHAEDGAWRLRRGEELLELPAGHETDVGAGRPWGAVRKESAPEWLAESTLPMAELKAAEALGQRNGIPFGTQGVALALEQACKDRSRDVRRLAVRGLAALGQHAALLDALEHPQHADVRTGAAAALRQQVRADGAAGVAAALQNSFGNQEAADLLGVLKGWPAAAKADPAKQAALQRLLDHDHVGVRELAAGMLRDLYGKDFGFNAGDPTPRRGAAVRAWRQAVEKR